MTDTAPETLTVWAHVLPLPITVERDEWEALDDEERQEFVDERAWDLVQSSEILSELAYHADGTCPDCPGNSGAN
jgi:hypothetical protein